MNSMNRMRSRGAGRVVAARKVQVVVVLDLGARNDLVELVVVAGVLEVHGDDGSKRGA